MKIGYKTAEMRTPRGLPRVWYCAHPADHAKYLDAFCRDILGAASCAVWFDEDANGEYDRGELCDVIGEMNLIVLPITRRFVTEGSRAADVELRLAEELHVPILPIAVEDGVEEAFNERIGEIQLLYRNEGDPSALSFHEKLTAFLSKALIDNGLTERIRAAFDAYIFLSYRKKDRRYARELMRLIHKNELCRDVAIWYDEYLLPGEKFNDSIKRALETSELFVLNVTPSILEKTPDKDGNERDNYVLATEYPMALELKKTVLPAETVKTDRGELDARLPSLPPCIPSSDADALSQSLTEAFCNVALRKSDSDPQHNFFIGRAYLNGIDVEKDHALALSLIVSAAEDGLTEAVEKLVFMYQHGEGVARDVRSEEAWRRRLIEHRKLQFEQSLDAWDAHMWLCEISQLVDLLTRTKRLPDARLACDDGYSLACRFLKEYESPLARKDLADTHYRLGVIEELSGKARFAAEHYGCALAITEDFTKRSDSFLVKRDYARDHAAIGRLYLSAGDTVSAKGSYLRAHSLLSDACADAEHSFLRSELAFICVQLGEISKELESVDDAEAYYTEACELYRKNAQMSQDPNHMRMLASTLGKIGNILRDKKNTDRASEHYLTAIEAYGSVPGLTDDDLEELALLYCRLATVSDEEGGLLALKKAKSIYDTLYRKHPDNGFYGECVDDLSDI